MEPPIDPSEVANSVNYTQVLQIMRLTPRTAQCTVYSAHDVSGRPTQQKVLLIGEKAGDAGARVAFAIPNASASTDKDPANDVSGYAHHLAIDVEKHRAFIAGFHQFAGFIMLKDGSIVLTELDEKKNILVNEKGEVVGTVFAPEKTDGNRLARNLKFVFHNPKEFRTEAGK